MDNAKRKLDHLAIGDRDCPKSDVLAMIVGSASFGKLHEEWRSLAIHIGLPDHKIRKLSEDYLLEIRVKTLHQLIDELLLIWRAEKGDEAKIVVLCEALQKCGLTDIADVLSSNLSVDSSFKPPKLTYKSQSRYYIPRTLLFIAVIVVLIAALKLYFEEEEKISGEGLYVTQDSLDLQLIVQVIEGSVSFALLLRNWRCFSDKLGVSEISMLDLERKLLTGVLLSRDLHREILKLWLAEKGKKATLDVLHGALVECDVRPIAESVLDKLITPESVKASRFLWKDELVTLEELLGENPSQGFYHTISNELKKNVPNKSLQIFNEQITPPAQPKYYIPRTLLVVDSTEVDVKMFLSDTAQGHIFLFKGISKPDLAKLTKYRHQIDKSGNQLYSVTVRFMVLEHDEDFDRICRGTNASVHVIQNGGEQYFWVKSNKNLDFIRQFLKEPTRPKSEQDLVNRIASSPAPCSFPIADSPGMGKTFLLANIANQIQQEQSDSITLLIVLQEFVHQVRLDNSNSTTALEAVAEYASSDEVTKLILFEKMKICQVYLFLDGYDEVIGEKSDILDNFLDNLQAMKNFKIIVTTRLHVRDRLENVFHQFSYEILPFDESNQVEFLVRYWIDKHGVKEGNELKEFSRKCLAALKTKLSNKEKEIAGIPLLCMMLAEVFAEDAKRASNVDTHNHAEIKPISFFHMYQKLIEMKFRKTQGLGQAIRNEHVNKAIKLLFPEWVDYFSSFVNEQGNANETTIYSTGLVEKPIENAPPRFVHRTFAEYLLAEFIVSNLGKHMAFVQFLFQVILGEEGTIEQGSKVDVHLLDRSYSQFTLKHPVIVYFVDMHLKEYSIEEVLIEGHRDTDINILDVCVSMRASCSNDLESILNFATSFWRGHTFELDVDDVLRDQKMAELGLYLIYFQDLPHVVVRNCENIGILDKALNFTEYWFGVELSHYINQSYISTVLYKPFPMESPLHVAVRAGKYNMALWLVQQFGNLVSEHKHLIHACVTRTSTKTKLVEEKLLIIDMLTSINRSWLEERDDFGGTPLLQKDVHLALLQRLVQNGADINAHSNVYGTVLHQATTENMYRDVVRWAFSNGFEQINKKNDVGRTPLLHAIKELGTLDDELLEIFLGAGAELNAEDMHGDSVLFYALSYSGNIEFIEKLMKLGADVHHKNRKDQNAVHKLMQRGKESTYDRLATLEMLVKLNPDWINERDQEGCTPLIVQRHPGDTISSTITRDIIDLRLYQRLVDYGANISAYSTSCGTVLHGSFDNEDAYKELARWTFSNEFKFVDHKDQQNRTLLMRITRWFQTQDGEILEKILDAGADVNAMDENGDSVLFYALQYSGNNEFINNLIERGADVHRINHLDQNALHKLMESEKGSPEKRLEIMDMLVGINRDWINGKDILERTPLLVTSDNWFTNTNCNLKLLERLVKHGADINVYSRVMGTVLHRNCADENELIQLVRWALTRGFNFKLLNVFLDGGLEWNVKKGQYKGVSKRRELSKMGTYSKTVEIRYSELTKYKQSISPRIETSRFT